MITPTEISVGELEKLEHLFQNSIFPLLIYPEHQTNLSRLSMVLKYLDSSRRSQELGLKISFYCMCFESLFSTDTTELSHKISERIAFFLGETPETRVKIYQNVKSAYSIRSKVVHGDNISSKSFEQMLEVALFCDNTLRNILNEIFSSEKYFQIFQSDTKTLERFLIDLTFGVH